MTTLSEAQVQEWIEATENNFDREMGDGEFPTAQEFIDEGVTVKQYRRWYSVYGWDIDAMKELESAIEGDDSLGVDDFEAKTDKGTGGYSSTIAYKYCNGDLGLSEAIEIAKANNA